MQKISSNLAYLQQKINEHETGIKQAREKLIQNGFSSNRVHYIFRALNKDVAQDIVDLVLDKAKEEEIRAIVSLPITLKGKIVGALRLYGSEVWDITKRDIEHLQVVAQNIGVAMD
jgi:transcriptional regulator with GAF, ATPase, and Fis domain